MSLFEIASRVPVLLAVFLLAASGRAAEDHGTAPALLMTDVANGPGTNSGPTPAPPRPAAAPPAGKAKAERRSSPAAVPSKAVLAPRGEARSDTDLGNENVSGVDRLEQNRKYEYQLALAQRQRRDKETKKAAQTLVHLLESPATEALKRTAMLELAAAARDDNDFPKAQQIYSQWLSLYPKDPRVPAVLLHQGLLYRKMGADKLALVKFYAVMSSALKIQSDRLEEYQRLVLLAQTEIADTYYLEGDFEKAAETFKSLLKLDSPSLNRATVQYKLVNTCVQLKNPAEVVFQAGEYLQRYPDDGKVAEVRFLLARALKELGRNSESLQQVTTLLETKSRSAAQSPADWAYWQQRTGNEIANQLYQEGDYLKALTIYDNLAKLDLSAQWQLPVWYQIGLVNERLNQPQQAKEFYGKILAREAEVAGVDAPGLRTVIDMAKWRIEYLTWEKQADKKTRQLRGLDEEAQTASAEPAPKSP